MNANTPHRFHWNAGALGGSAIGLSLWMPVTALVSGWPTMEIVVAIAAAATILVAALVLWGIHHRISSFHGMMMFLAVGFFVTLMFFAAAHLLDLPLVNGWPEGERVPPLSHSWVLLLYPALAGLFWLLNSGSDRSEPGGDEPSPRAHVSDGP